MPKNLGTNNLRVSKKPNHQKNILSADFNCSTLEKINDSPFDRLKLLRDQIIDMQISYDDVSDEIEEAAYKSCDFVETKTIIHEIEILASFFEQLENKNEEINRDLSDIYILIGHLYQSSQNFDESIAWFSKAAVVDDQYALAFHNLSFSLSKLGEIAGAIKSLEQELTIAPGNYYTYIVLAQLYEENNQFEMAENCLKRLLERDPENIQGLHALIQFYKKNNPTINSGLLIKRILRIRKNYTSSEILIRMLYLLEEKQITTAVNELETYNVSPQNNNLILLLQIFFNDYLKNFAKRDTLILQLKNIFQNNKKFIQLKVDEFAAVFGTIRAEEMKKILLN